MKCWKRIRFSNSFGRVLCWNDLHPSDFSSMVMQPDNVHINKISHIWFIPHVTWKHNFFCLGDICKIVARFRTPAAEGPWRERFGRPAWWVVLEKRCHFLPKPWIQCGPPSSCNDGIPLLGAISTSLMGDLLMQPGRTTRAGWLKQVQQEFLSTLSRKSIVELVICTNTHCNDYLLYFDCLWPSINHEDWEPPVSLIILLNSKP